MRPNLMSYIVFSLCMCLVCPSCMFPRLFTNATICQYLIVLFVANLTQKYNYSYNDNFFLATGRDSNKITPDFFYAEIALSFGCKLNNNIFNALQHILTLTFLSRCFPFPKVVIEPVFPLEYSCLYKSRFHKWS